MGAKISEEEFRVRFWSKIARRETTECWEWQGKTAAFGYGRCWFRGGLLATHRVAWILTFGEIPATEGADCRGTCVLHRCDNPRCCNPAHLFLGTHLDNMADKVRKRRDTTKHKPLCKHGHPRTPDNLYVSKDGLAHCRTCHREKEQRRRKARGLSTPKLIEFQGEKLRLSEWCRRLGLHDKTVRSRINTRGWSTARALSTPTPRRPEVC